MDLSFFMPLIENMTLGPNSGASEAAAVGTAVVDATQTAGAGGLFGGIGGMGILMYVVVLGGLWFFMIRPQKKREKAAKEMQAALGVGDNVMTSAGFYGIITGIGEDCFVVEFGTNKGVRIPVRKVDIVGIKEPVLTPVKEKEPDKK